MSTQLNPTQYNSAPYKTTIGLSAIDNQTQGSLTALIQQTCTVFPSVTSTNPEEQTYEESWKGPSSILKDIPNGDKTYGSWKIGNERPDVSNNLKFVVRFSQPKTYNDFYKWIIQSIEIEQLAAGDHSLMKVSYRQKYAFGEKDPDQKDIVTKIKNKVEWNLTWGSNNVNVLAYCNAALSKPACKIRKINNSIGSDNFVPQNPDAPNIKSNPENIINCSNNVNGDSPVDLLPYQWIQGNYVCELRYNEKLIKDKYSANANPVFHYPIITKTTTLYTKLNDYSKVVNDFITGDIDVIYHEGNEIKDIPDCPLIPRKPKWAPNGRWEFLKTAENVSFINKTNEFNSYTYVIQEVWWGSYNSDPQVFGEIWGFDKDFYGWTNRWQLNSL